MMCIVHWTAVLLATTAVPMMGIMENVTFVMHRYENYFLDTITFITSLQKVGK